MVNKYSTRDRLIVWFSCGAASAVAAHLAVEKYADDYDVHICYCDLLADEHPDNARFLKDVEQWIGCRVELLHSPKYRTIHQVFRGERYIVGVHGAPCTKILKREVRLVYQRPTDVHVFGFTADEMDRIQRFKRRYPDVDTENVLLDCGFTKQNCLCTLAKAGIELPAMYRLGYHNNNCLGCVKGGMGYWNKIRGDFPERFAQMVAIEHEIGATILRRGGKRLPLCELPLGVGRHTDLEISCDVFCDMREPMQERETSMPRGQKTCPKCGTTCGPRTRECPAVACDHQFAIKGKKPSSSGPPRVGPPSLSKRPGPPSLPPKQPTVEPGDAPVVIVAADPYEIDKFILALKEARDANRHSGGGYAAFFHVDDEVVLRFDVQVPIDLLPFSHKKVT